MTRKNNTDITSFSGKHAFLSNFYFSAITAEGMCYPTVEHAFQASKTHSFLEKDRISYARTPGIAKRMGRTVHLRPDWESVKVFIMHDLLRHKFKNPYLKDLLRTTRGRKLIEGNNWNDCFWGVCDGLGDNVLGLLLMEVRHEQEKEQG